MGRRYERLKPGQVFGRLTVLEESAPPTEYTSYKGRWYRCRCQCGNTVFIRGNALVTGNTKSCGCLRREHARDVALERNSRVCIAPGQVFGRLTVLEEAPAPTEFTTYKGRWYRCRCQCGNTVVIRRDSLVSGNTKSCGCLQREHIANLNKRKEVRK